MAETGQKILLVDDDITFLNLYKAVFISQGFSFSLAENGAQALEIAKAEKPSLILLDIMLPDLDGLEVLRRLKTDPLTAQIPVWMLTNLSEQINQEKATSLGATNYLVKSSVTPLKVVEKIKNFFNPSGTPL